MVGVAVAIPAASLCINRRLYKIASCQTATITLAHVRQQSDISQIHLTLSALETPGRYSRLGYWTRDPSFADGSPYVVAVPIVLCSF